MDDLAAATWYETAVLCVLTDAERYLGHAVRTAQGWAAYDGTHPNPEGNGFNELGSFMDIADAKVAVEDSAGFCRQWAGSEITSATFIGQKTSRDGVQHNVYKMPFSKVENQTRFRD